MRIQQQKSSQREMTSTQGKREHLPRTKGKRECAAARHLGFRFGMGSPRAHTRARTASTAQAQTRNYDFPVGAFWTNSLPPTSDIIYIYIYIYIEFNNHIRQTRRWCGMNERVRVTSIYSILSTHVQSMCKAHLPRITA